MEQSKDDYINQQLNKAAILGTEHYVIKCTPEVAHVHLLVHKDKQGKHGEILIPSNVEYIRDIENPKLDFILHDIDRSVIHQLVSLKTIGGSGLKSCASMFASLEFTKRLGTSLKEIDVSMLDTSNVENMTEMCMFVHCSIKGMEKLDTHKVTSMEGMFYKAVIKSCIDLTNFDTSNVEKYDRYV